MIIDGIAVIARGVARHTIDIDATIWAEALDPEVSPLRGFPSSGSRSNGRRPWISAG